MRAIDGVETRRTSRKQRCPTPELIMVQGSLTRPPRTVFSPSHLLSLFHPNQPPVTQGQPVALMSRYFVHPVALLFILDLRRTRLTTVSRATGSVAGSPLMEATSQLQYLLTCHQTYETPWAFSIPLPFSGPYHDTLTWLTHELPAVEPTSASVHGTFTAEVFRWNDFYERYEIVLDDLGLEDIGLLTGDA